jgi:hypothetical protein
MQADTLQDAIDRFVMLSAILESELIQDTSDNCDDLFDSRQQSLSEIQGLLSTGESLSTDQRITLAHADQSINLVLDRVKSNLRTDIGLVQSQRKTRAIYNSDSTPLYELTS